MGLSPSLALEALPPAKRIAAVARCLMRRTLRGPKACLVSDVAHALGLSERSLDRERQRLNALGFDIRLCRYGGEAGFSVHGAFTREVLEISEARALATLLRDRWLSRSTLLWRCGLSSAELRDALARAADVSGLVLAQRRRIGGEEMFSLRSPARASVCDRWAADVLRAAEGAPDAILRWTILEPFWSREQRLRRDGYRKALARLVAEGTLTKCDDGNYRLAARSQLDIQEVAA